MAYGTDLLGESHGRQCEEFAIRARVLPSRDVLASATTVAAKLVGLEGQVGMVREGALADLIAVDGNPLENVALLADPRANLRFVMKGGRVCRDHLDA